LGSFFKLLDHAGKDPGIHESKYPSPGPQQKGGNPNPADLVHHHFFPPGAEEASQPEGRDSQRGPGKGIAGRVKGRKEGHPVAPAGHRIQDAMGTG